MNHDGQIVEGTYPPGYPVRPAKFDTKYIVLDSTKIKKTIGWKPLVTLDEGLRITIDSWKSLS